MLDASDAILFTNSFSTFPTIKRHFSHFFLRILSILFYVQWPPSILHKIIKKCVFGEMKKKARAASERALKKV